MDRDVHLAYGTGGLTVALPADRTTVVEPRWEETVTDPRAVLLGALRRPVAGSPLRERVRPGQTVAVSVCDVTRPQPRELMLRALLEELEGITRLEDVVVLVATGTHRANTDAELRAMLGDELVDTLRIVNHDARDASSLTWMGTFGDGVPLWLDSEWVQADVRITTGFVEPHFFAGFSGGPKMIVPGLAGLDTVLVLHDASHIGHPEARWGVIEGNPVHDDVRACAAATGCDFALDVVLNREQGIVAAFGGDLFAMHAQARERSRSIAMAPVPHEFEVVLTTNSGFPLDQNLYQAVKGMSAGATVVREGGVIVCAAECRDGFPDHGSYRQVLASQPSPRALFDEIAARARTVPDQWQVQVQTKIQMRARVGVHSGNLSDDDLRSAHLEPVGDIAAFVGEALGQAGPQARVCVLPEGPQTIPYLV